MIIVAQILCRDFQKLLEVVRGRSVPKQSLQNSFAVVWEVSAITTPKNCSSCQPCVRILQALRSHLCVISGLGPGARLSVHEVISCPSLNGDPPKTALVQPAPPGPLSHAGQLLAPKTHSGHPPAPPEKPGTVRPPLPPEREESRSPGSPTLVQEIAGAEHLDLPSDEPVLELLSLRPLHAAGHRGSGDTSLSGQLRNLLRVPHGGTKDHRAFILEPCPQRGGSAPAHRSCSPDPGYCTARC